MKKILLLFVISFYLFSCKSSSELKKYPVVDPATVKLMVDQYKGLTFDINKNVLQWITFPNKELRKLAKYKHDIRFIPAAYYKDSGNYKKNNITLIMQLWRNGLKDYYDINSIFQSGDTKGEHTYGITYQVICPPPINCDYSSQPDTD
jgi:hypothetical protein